MWLTKRGQKRILKNCFSQPKDLVAKKERTEMIIKVLSSYLYHLFETLAKKILEINQELSKIFINGAFTIIYASKHKYNQLNAI